MEQNCPKGLNKVPFSFRCAPVHSKYAGKTFYAAGATCFPAGTSFLNAGTHFYSNGTDQFDAATFF
jgi:hypothetical protein